VPQEPFLFSGSAGENIGMGLEVDPQRIARSAAIAQVEFDLQTPVNGLGPQASGQIALARGLTTPMFPGLLLLDDPFSAVDLETEAKLIRALRQAFGPEAPPDQRATLLLSSPRLAAFPQMDQVVVLDHGRVIETGNHAELISAGGLYARIFRAQALIAHKNGGV
jgi:ABC-type multidrug transport system fused ATPase/permease subunit